MSSRAPEDAALAASLELPEGRRVFSAADAARLTLQGPGVSHVVGAAGPAAALAGHALQVASGRPVVIVTPDLESARRTTDDLAFVLTGSAEPLPVLLFTPSETNPYGEVHPERRAAMQRLATLFHLASGARTGFVVVPATALVRRVPPRTVILPAAVRLVAEDGIDLDAVVRQLTCGGYLRTPIVEDPGTFAVRGGLLDVWPAQLDTPVRAELYGDLLVSIKRFDPETQRTGDLLAEVWLPPAREAILTPEVTERARETMRGLADAVNLPSGKARRLSDDVATGKQFYGAEGYLPACYELESLASYFPAEAAVVVEEPPRVVRVLLHELEEAHQGAARRSGTPHFPVDSLYVTPEAIADVCASRPTLALHRVGVAGGGTEGILALESAPEDAPTLALRDQGDLERAIAAARTSHGKHEALAPLVTRLALWSDHGLRVTLTARTTTQAERLAQLLSHRGLAVAVDDGGTRPERSDPGVIRVTSGPLSSGVLSVAGGFVWVTEEEIFGRRAHREREPRRSPRGLLEDLRALAPLDHVVHVDHGIGRYLGLEKRSVSGGSLDLLVVEYAGGDKLFLPVHRLNQIQKYSGGEGSPKLDRLGGTTFAKAKARVQKKVREMADELLRLYAERNAIVKDPLPAPSDDYSELEASFPYEETRDQASAIADVLADLQVPRVMDRLVCGDVGFGKTEVALRAAFHNVVNGRQVAVLCPTTVLAQQHYLTFSKRLREFPISIRALSRFESKADQEEVVKGLRGGSVDIVIGTHRVLSKDVHVKNLGLLVIDEEQRFGVTHKERLKQLKTSVDVLTLTATPIPRTLQLAVGGLRDMSVITTPPADRRAIRTITSQHDEALIRDAVLRELGRGGQVFYVHNRVEGLYERAARLREIVPEARVAVGHGQLDEATLEQTMLDFVEGKFDILASTAIIESGLDIPRANTMIVDRADLFGLSQLYQLRGRVGRSSERAYCYLLVPPPSQLTDEARYRIEALEKHTELGAGFQVASLDMELRGAGNLLGGEQSGFVSSVGFELFCQMLEEATQELRGEPVVHDVDPELSFDVDAFIPDDYVSEVGVRLSLYKRLAGALVEGDVTDLAAEMEDRFGPAPEQARRLVELMRLKVDLRRLRALGCEATARHVTLHLRDDTPLDPARIATLVAAKKSPFRITPELRLTRRAAEGERVKDGLDLAARMLSELSSCLRTVH